MSRHLEKVSAKSSTPQKSQLQIKMKSKNMQSLPYSNRISPWLTAFGPLPWQVKQSLSALCQLQPATYAGQIMLVYGIYFQIYGFYFTANSMQI